MVTVLSSHSTVLLLFLFQTLEEGRFPEFPQLLAVPWTEKSPDQKIDLLLSDMALSWQKFCCCLCNFILLLSIQYFPGTAFKNKAQLFCHISPRMTASMENMEGQSGTSLRSKMSSVQMLVSLQHSRGTPPPPNRRVALQKVPSKAPLGFGTPHL